MQETVKKCSCCELDKCLDMFSKNKSKKDGLQYKCKACERQYQIDNKSKISIYQSEYYNRNINNINAYNTKNKDKIKSRKKLYRNSDIGKTIHKNTDFKRRSLTKQGDVTTLQLQELQQNAKTCYWCEISLKNKTIHIDHYIPLSKGGEHTLNNLVVSCSSCNQSKNAKDPIVFANSVGKLL